MPVVDWAKLVRQDRAKAYGVAWSEEELKAIHERGMDPDDVRKGLLRPEDLDGMKDRRDNERKKRRAIYNTPLNALSKKDLIWEARDRGLQISGAEKKQQLLKMLSEGRKKARKKEEGLDRRTIDEIMSSRATTLTTKELKREAAYRDVEFEVDAMRPELLSLVSDARKKENNEKAEKINKTSILERALDKNRTVHLKDEEIRAEAEHRGIEYDEFDRFELIDKISKMRKLEKEKEELKGR